VVSYALIGCPDGALDLRTIDQGKRDTHSVPRNTLAGDDVHLLNGPIAQRHTQLIFNQEIKSL
jgi:hypothetical protein